MRKKEQALTQQAFRYQKDETMFGKKKAETVQLTNKQIKDLKKSMSLKELRSFNRQQKDLKKQERKRRDDAFWDGLLWGSLLIDDD